jgi:hypothetical protein
VWQDVKKLNYNNLNDCCSSNDNHHHEEINPFQNDEDIERLILKASADNGT